MPKFFVYDLNLFLSLATKSCDDLNIAAVYKMKNGENRNAKGDGDHFACVPVPLVYVSYRCGTEQVSRLQWQQDNRKADTTRHTERSLLNKQSFGVR